MALGDERGLTLEQAMAAQTALRDLLGLPPERFGVDQFIGMLGDEIGLARAAGHTDQQIATLLAAHTGQPIHPEDVALHDASSEARRRRQKG